MEFATITPTRDRPELLKFCKQQLNRMTVKPAKSYFIDYPPPNGTDKDLVKRVYEGCLQAKRDGIDFVFLIEDDDYYQPWYFEYMKVSESTNFIGIYETIYYNISTLRYQRYLHAKRASLFCTGFRISALNKFRWPNQNSVFLDIDLWQYAYRVVKLGIELKQNHFRSQPAAIGIKGHGIGLVGGKGHTLNLQMQDDKMHWLLTNIEDDSFDFYKSLHEKICV